jgi:hypothetical protein
MKKIGIGIIGIIACSAASSYADGYGQEDQGFIAGKGQFPGPGSGQEGTLPQTDMTDDDTDNTKPKPKTPGNGQTEKDIMPDVNSNKPQGGKEIFPQEKSPAKKIN